VEVFRNSVAGHQQLSPSSSSQRKVHLQSKKGIIDKSQNFTPPALCPPQAREMPRLAFKKTTTTKTTSSQRHKEQKERERERRERREEKRREEKRGEREREREQRERETLTIVRRLGSFLSSLSFGEVFKLKATSRLVCWIWMCRSKEHKKH